MESTVVSLYLVVFMFALLGCGLWVAFSLLGVGFLAMELSGHTAIGEILTTAIWASSNTWALAALPLFIWLGEILARAKAADDVFGALAPWIRRLPGGLIHIHVLGCGLFAAIAGSSVATALTMGRMSVPELLKRGYDEKLTLGSLAGSGTLGFLIPPSITLLIYGVAVDVSIPRLFLAGVVPGLVLIVLFMAYVVVWSKRNPDKTPEPEAPIGFRQKMKASSRVLPIMVLIIGVLGSIYSGIASPTDAASVGVALAFLITWASRRLTRSLFSESLMGAIRSSCMIVFILLAASFLTVAMGFTGIPRTLASWIVDMELSSTMLIVSLTLLYIILGCFLDGISMVVLTTAVIYPIIDRAGFDPIWFGVYITVCIEMAQITPPVGFNLFVLQSLTGRDIVYLAKCSMPFFFLLNVLVALLFIFPELATWLPDYLNG
jgi:tripartite ATP-independent transporter DctM subunit